MSTDEETTGELDTTALGALLQKDVEHTLADPPTVRLERDRLLDLLEESGPKTVHTIARAPREQEPALDVELLSTDLRPSLSPLVICAVIAVLFGLFFAVMHAA